MIFDDIAAFAAALPQGRALMGLDPGTKTIGVAVSDRLLSAATPLETVKRLKFSLDAARLTEIATHREIGGMIIGLPANMDGTAGDILEPGDTVQQR